MIKTDTCWKWTAAKTASGYGVLRVTGKNLYAHRLSYEAVNGVVEGKTVLHKCDNPACVNPRHLFVGNQQDNVADMVAKERQSRGETNGNNKLTDALVVSMRKRFVRGCKVNGVNAIARELGVSNGVVSEAISRKTWKHVK